MVFFLFFLTKLLCVLIPLTHKVFSCLGRGHSYFLTSQNGETGSRHLSGDTQGEQRVHEGWDVAGRLSCSDAAAKVLCLISASLCPGRFVSRSLELLL